MIFLYFIYYYYSDKLGGIEQNLINFQNSIPPSLDLLNYYDVSRLSIVQNLIGRMVPIIIEIKKYEKFDPSTEV